MRVHLAGPVGTVRLFAYRLGWYRGTGARLVWTSPRIKAHRQPAPVVTTDRMVVAPEPIPFSMSLRSLGFVEHASASSHSIVPSWTSLASDWLKVCIW